MATSVPPPFVRGTGSALYRALNGPIKRWALLLFLCFFGNQQEREKAYYEYEYEHIVTSTRVPFFRRLSLQIACQPGFSLLPAPHFIPPPPLECHRWPMPSIACRRDLIWQLLLQILKPYHGV